MQQALGAGTVALARAGILVPNSGRGEWPEAGGHHAIAAELEKFPCDRGRQVETNRLIAELRDAAQPHAIVSSEDFSMHASVAALSDFGAALREVGLATTSVLYVRDRAAFVESSYAEWVKHGTTWTFDELLASVLDRANVIDESATARPFVFQYASLAAGLARAFGDVRVRAYDANWSKRELLEDFAQAARLPEIGALQATDIRYNARLDFAAIAERFLRNRGDSDPAKRLSEFADAPFFHAPFEVLEHDDVARLGVAFSEDDRLLAERYGVQLHSEAAARPGPSAAREALRTIGR